MAVATYDPSNLTLSILGSDPHGFADGEFLRAVPDEDLFTKTVGADREVARVKNAAGMSGTLVLTLLQSSTFNAVMSAAAALDQASGAGVGPFVYKEGGTVLAAGECWVKRLPDAAWGKEMGTREWIIEVAKFTAYFLGGN